MTTVQDEFGLWELTQASADHLRIHFLTPSDRRLKIEHNVRLAMKIGYAGFLALALFSDGINGDRIAGFFAMLLLIPFASSLRRGGHGDNRFIPYLVTVDNRAQCVELTDPRAAHAQTKVVPFADLQAIFLDTPGGQHAAPGRIVMQLRDGEKIRLPAHGLDAHFLLDPLRARLPGTVSFAAPTLT